VRFAAPRRGWLRVKPTAGPMADKSKKSPKKHEKGAPAAGRGWEDRGPGPRLPGRRQGWWEGKNPAGSLSATAFEAGSKRAGYGIHRRSSAIFARPGRPKTEGVFLVARGRRNAEQLDQACATGPDRGRLARYVAEKLRPPLPKHYRQYRRRLRLSQRKKPGPGRFRQFIASSTPIRWAPRLPRPTGRDVHDAERARELGLKGSLRFVKGE